MASTVTDCGDVRIITQVLPQIGSLSTQGAADRVSDSTSGASQFIVTHKNNMKNTLLKVLGVIQIVFGATHVSFGIALTIIEKITITVESGVYFWIGILLLISGALLVEVEKRQPIWLVKSTFFANLLVSVAGLVAVILHATEIAQAVKKGNPCDMDKDMDTDTMSCRMYFQVLPYGLNTVFIIFLLLEMSLAITALIRIESQKQQSYQPMATSIKRRSY